MKKVLQTLTLALAIFRVSGQDPHLSMYYMAPLYINPALTGAFDGNYRLDALYRGQWASVLQNEAVPEYRTYTFSADFRTDRGFAKGDAFGFGASFVGDQAGEAKFGYNVGGISVAYHKSLNERHTNYLALGFSSQIYDQTFDNSNLQWGNQWDFTTGSYNPNINPNEAIVDSKKLYWDINAGLLWYMKIGRKTDIYLGASGYHLNTPDISVYGNSAVRLNMKYVGTGGITFPLGGRFYLQPKFIFMDQGQSIETMWTAEVKVLFDQHDPESGNFRFGAMMRMVGGDPNAPWTDNRLDPESVVLTTGVEWNHINLGVAYDINVSSLLSATDSRGAFEVGLTYIGKWTRSAPQTIYCPKF